MAVPKATIWSRHSSQVSKARPEEEEARRRNTKLRKLRIFLSKIQE
jgi:hypothetical protein